jgi:hypothetical protein
MAKPFVMVSQMVWFVNVSSLFMFGFRAEIQKALSQFSLLAEFLIVKVPVKDKDRAEFYVGES